MLFHYVAMVVRHTELRSSFRRSFRVLINDWKNMNDNIGAFRGH